MSIRWSLSFKQIVAPQEPITYHVRQPTVCSSLWPVSICGSSIPVYTYLREFLDPYEMKLQGNTVNQQAHQHLRYFFRWKHEMMKLLLLRVQWRQNIYMDWSTIWSTWKIRSSWSRILTSSLLKKIHWMEIRFYPSFGQVAIVSSEMYWWIVSFSGPRTEQCHKILRDIVGYPRSMLNVGITRDY